jgi:hypothetical protein
VKKKKIDMLLVFNIFAFVCLIACLALLLFFTTNSKDSEIEKPGSIPGTLCLEQPIVQIPETIPQRKPYDENFHRMNYHYYPTWWEPQLNNIQKFSMPGDWAEIVLLTDKDLWFITGLDGLYKFNLQTRKVESYKIYDEEIKPFGIFDLFKSKQGTIWAVGSTFPRDGGYYSTLARYRPKTNDFEIIKDQDGMFMKTGADTPLSFGGRIYELSDGQLIVAIKWKIYIYNPITNKASLLYEKGHVEKIVIDDYDNIWFVNKMPDTGLYRLRIDTGEIVNFGSPPQLSKLSESEGYFNNDFGEISIDKQGRVWVSYFDRLEPDGKGVYHWKSLELPAVMVDTNDLFYSYMWVNTLSSLVTTNGDIWFTTNVGTVKYDNQENTWCLSAITKPDASPSLVEDVEGNLWTIDRRQIYKLENQK